MTKILLFTADFPPVAGGIQTYSYEIAKNLNELGEDIIVLALKDDGYEEFDKNQDIKIIRKWFPSNNYLKVMLLFFYLAYYTKKYKINIIHSTAWLPCGVASSFLYKMFGVPYVVTTHAVDVLEPQTSSFRTMVIKSVLKNAKKIISVSNYTKGILLELGIPKENIEVIPNGVDYKRFDANIDYFDIIKKHSIQGKKVILTVGRLVKRKGHGMVIKSLPEVIKKVPNMVYLVVGDGPLRNELEELVKKLKLEKYVVFAGYIAYEDLPKYYTACDVFIMPSREIKEKGDVEGFGIVYLEANACGKPVIGGKSGGVVDAIEDDVTGLLVDPQNINDISNALIKLLTSKEYSSKLGVNGRKRVEKEFNWKNIAGKTRNVLKSCVNE